MGVLGWRVTPGQLARRLLGPAFPFVGRLYRAMFVDLDEVAACVPASRDDPEILDIGGGDGELLNRLLRRFPRAHVTMLDLSDEVGGALPPELAARVTRRPGTSIRQYRGDAARAFDLVLVSDVVHHIPDDQRRAFFEDLRDLIAGRRVTLFVKDIEPGSWRATAANLTDRYISGDRRAELVAEASLRRLLAEVFPGSRIAATDLIRRDPPNYALVVTVN